MRKLRIIIPVAASLLGLLGLFGSAAPAMAATPAHAASHTGKLSFVLAADPKVGETRTQATLLTNDPVCGDTYVIFLTNAGTYSVIGNGVGNQATISNSIGNNWNFHCPSGGYSLWNGSGHCLALDGAYDGANVIVSDTTPCTDSRRLFNFTHVPERDDWIAVATGYDVFVGFDSNGEGLSTELLDGGWNNWNVG